MITRDDVIALGICESGLVEFDSVFPNGIGNYKEAIARATAMDESGINPAIQHAEFINFVYETLTKQGRLESTMVEKYQVFNPLTGSHAQYDTLEEAKVARQAVIDAYVQANVGLFSIAQEIITGEGNSLWNPLTADQIQ